MIVLFDLLVEPWKTILGCREIKLNVVFNIQLLMILVNVEQSWHLIVSTFNFNLRTDNLLKSYLSWSYFSLLWLIETLSFRWSISDKEKRFFLTWIVITYRIAFDFDGFLCKRKIKTRWNFSEKKRLKMKLWFGKCLNNYSNRIVQRKSVTFDVFVSDKKPGKRFENCCSEVVDETWKKRMTEILARRTVSYRRSWNSERFSVEYSVGEVKNRKCSLVWNPHINKLVCSKPVRSIAFSFMFLRI